MSKLGQLQWFKRLGLPTPAFRELTFASFQQEQRWSSELKFPLAVRSTYAAEDGADQSFAGHFHTELGVKKEQLPAAVEAVFASYPTPERQSVILQEMIEPDYAGVLFAYRHGVWKVEWVEGRGERLVSGQVDPKTILLPRFGGWDRRLVNVLGVWKGVTSEEKVLRPAFVALSCFAGQLLADSEVEHGLDIEFAIRAGRLYLLQARPLTTPEELEEVLTSANHKEILPPFPSRLMTSIIVGAGEALFSYYRDLDPDLSPRRFIEPAAGMPWINLSALLDTMVQWGLPTRLVCDSVGAEDPYRVGLRPYVLVRKIPVFMKILRQQGGSRRAVRRWVDQWRAELPHRQEQRARQWEEEPGSAFAEWRADFSRIYVELVTHMQTLTGAMSGPVALLSRLGILERIAPRLQQKSASTDYLQAFRKLESGTQTLEEFLEDYGHRGFYESDIGQRRFWEYGEEDWRQLIQGESPNIKERSTKVDKLTNGLTSRFVSLLFEPVVRLIHAREWVRHESMRFFWSLRKEMNEKVSAQFGEGIRWWSYTAEDLGNFFGGESYPTAEPQKNYEPQSGWDMDTFLANRHGRRLPLSVLSNISLHGETRQSLGIFPGRVRGQVWRVRHADFAFLEKPEFETVILVADALDPGWIPFFSQVDGVATYVGGLLSHASIVLREARIPAVTQLSTDLELQTGDWIELDGKAGTVQIL